MANSYSWSRSIKDCWEEAVQNPPDTAHYQKLVLLAQLKAAHALARYTWWLVFATVLLVICTALQVCIAFGGR